ncbi:MAG: oxaloacetate decarboxylase [Gammaproteobacteria bacterium]|nr:oxaloacetate decarboxylase [Gammaproteobacteria bacterium]MCP4091028.1 oxaloacetate decarboxylase [Gammaproteobacteria bacterium]MCP4277446.1 oxaloacetate decarboxylase [Gammaproteobacteria bacterium]MCP4831493.1 oxaloacetate decarboxylase [Gammaproteobacteria bacterium]MCP4927716.1 oxaloacetate decarboxylase [Gammaproteobacteria bacterium]
MSQAADLRKKLAGSEAIIAPGAYDALTALMVEQAGFQCAYVSGASISFARIGRPDLGLTTLTEVADSVANMRERTEISLVVDADTGFGNALNVQRSVRLLERMGATGIQLEDQTSPKRCGHLAGKSIVSVDEMVGKLKAALDARNDDDTLIVARTDAIAIDGVDAAIERAHAYADAGADVLFIEAMPDKEVMTRVGKEIGGRVPLLANMVEGGKTPLTPASELAELGFRLVIYPGAMVRIISFAAQAYLHELKEKGTTAGLLDKMNQFDQIMDLVGLQESIAEGKAYDPEIKAARD